MSERKIYDYRLKVNGKLANSKQHKFRDGIIATIVDDLHKISTSNDEVIFEIQRIPT